MGVVLGSCMSWYGDGLFLARRWMCRAATLPFTLPVRCVGEASPELTSQLIWLAACRRWVELVGEGCVVNVNLFPPDAEKNLRQDQMLN